MECFPKTVEGRSEPKFICFRRRLPGGCHDRSFHGFSLSGPGCRPRGYVQLIVSNMQRRMPEELAESARGLDHERKPFLAPRKAQRQPDRPIDANLARADY